MSWMPSQGWVTYLQLNAPSSTVTYDLGVGGDGRIRLASFGASPARTASAPAPPDAPPQWLMAVVIVVAVLLVVVSALLVRRVRFGGGAPGDPYAP